MIDDQFNTSVKGVKCIGDVTFGPMLAHKAEEEGLCFFPDQNLFVLNTLNQPGIAAAEYLITSHGHVDYTAIPSVVYTHPVVLWVGQSYQVSKFPFAANSQAKTNMDAEGFVKILAEKETGKILEARIIGPNAGEMISEGVVTVNYGTSAEDIARVTHAHVHSSPSTSHLASLADTYCSQC